MTGEGVGMTRGEGRDSADEGENDGGGEGQGWGGCRQRHFGGMLAAASVGGCGRLLWNGEAPSCGCYCFTVIGRIRAFFDSCLGNEMLSTPFW